MARSDTQKADSTAEQIQENVDEAEAKGHLGVKPSRVPNSAYTVAGVTSGTPTPETDEALADEAHMALRGRTGK